jgi:hypothetical protein
VCHSLVTCPPLLCVAPSLLTFNFILMGTSKLMIAAYSNGILWWYIRNGG